MSAQKNIFRRSLLVFAVLTFGFVAVVGRAIYIQKVHGQHYRSLAKKMMLATHTIDAQRGNIYAQDGSLLATTITRYDLRFDAITSGLTPEIFREKVDSLAAGLARILDGEQSEFSQMLWEARRLKRSDLLLARNVDYIKLQQVRALPLINLAQSRKSHVYRGGLVVEPHTHRERPMGRLASRTVGYHKPESQQKAVGLEAAFDSALAGVPAQSRMRRIANGMWIPVDGLPLVQPKHGMDVISTLDMQLQDVADEALCHALHHYKASHGTVVVMEVATGNIRAMVNLSRTEGVTRCDEQINYAVTESQDPGSTFKLISMLVALEDAGVAAHTQVDLNGGVWDYGSKTMFDASRHGIGEADLTEIFAKSSNVGVSRLIQQFYGNNPQRFIKKLQELGVEKPTGISLAHEGQPKITKPNTTEWSNVSLPWLSVGYGLNLTPLQVLCLYNAVANQGKRVTPRLVDGIRNPSTGQIQTTPVQVDHKPIASAKTLNALNQMLRAVVEQEGGTGKRLQNPAYSVAAKTGTAQMLVNHQYVKRYRGSVAGFFPAERPRYSMVVMLADLGDSAYYGGVVAGSVFRKVADHLYARGWGDHGSKVPNPWERDSLPRTMVSGLEMPTQKALEQLGMAYRIVRRPSAETDKANSARGAGSSYVQAQCTKGTWNLTQVNVRKGIVADLTGMGLTDALQVAGYLGYPTEVYGRGRVIRQNPVPGTPQASGKHLTLYLQ
ncbi:MAG: penicillin-binding transpeptidase domain-containing protein [Bacteroidia bacterium]|jgi:cell division protein FtsI (penicillin-binding protein 3)